MNNLIYNQISNLCNKIIQYNFNDKLQLLNNEKDLFELQVCHLNGFNKELNITINNINCEIDKLTKITNDIIYVNELLILLQDSEFTDALTENEIYSIDIDLNKILDNIHKYILSIVFNDEVSGKNAILSIHSGSGGVEAEDFAGMLMRMYLMWCKANSFTVDIINIIHSLEANEGIKKVDIFIKGKNVYGLLNNETGIHRLIRKSPFDKAQRRHTSFCSVKVIPELDDDITIKLDERNDVRIDTLRGTGAGGQHRNKTDSCVRLTHYETGIVVMCQSDRSQHKNKANAFKVLRGRLYELELMKKKNAQQIDYKNINGISWGNQIRSYIKEPDQIIKDHRNGYTMHDFDDVLNGNIDPFIFKLLYK